MRVTVLPRSRWLRVRFMPLSSPSTRRSPGRARRSSSVDVAEHDIDRAEDRHDVGDEPALEQPREDLEVVERRATHLRAERVRRRAAGGDHVDPDLTLRALDRVVRLALRALPDVPEARPPRAAGDVRDALADDRDRAAQPAEPHLVARVRVTLDRGHRLEARELGIDGVRTVLPEIPVHAGCAEDRDRKSTRLNSSHQIISYAVFCLKKKKKYRTRSLSVS